VNAYIRPGNPPEIFFLGNIISLGVIEKRLLYRYLPHRTNVSSTFARCLIARCENNFFLHPLISIAICVPRSPSGDCLQLFDLLKLQFDSIVPRRSQICNSVINIVFSFLGKLWECPERNITSFQV
jgi:hypothetical protein